MQTKHNVHTMYNEVYTTCKCRGIEASIPNDLAQRRGEARPTLFEAVRIEAFLKTFETILCHSFPTTDCHAPNRMYYMKHA